MEPLVWHGATDHKRTDRLVTSAFHIGVMGELAQFQGRSHRAHICFCTWLNGHNWQTAGEIICQWKFTCAKVDNLPGYHRWMEERPGLQNSVKFALCGIEMLPSTKIRNTKTSVCIHVLFAYHNHILSKPWWQSTVNNSVSNFNTYYNILISEAIFDGQNEIHCKGPIHHTKQ